MPDDLPPPRADGRCAGCNAPPKKVVTTDGRFCRPCLLRTVARLSPGDAGEGHEADEEGGRRYMRVRGGEYGQWREVDCDGAGQPGDDDGAGVEDIIRAWEEG